MSWTAIDGQELALIERRVRFQVRPARFDGYIHQPPFYRHGALIRLETGDKTRTYVAAGAGALSGRRYFPLDGCAESIRQANQAAQLEIDIPDEAEAYLRFFCTYLRTAAGTAFTIVDAIEPGWATDKREQIDVRPLTVWHGERPGYFRACGFVEHTGELMIAKFAIQFDGLIAMLEDEPLGRLICMRPN